MAFRTRSIAVVVGTVLSLATFAWPAAADDGSGTPGLYAHAASSPSAATLVFTANVTQKPSANANVFWSNSFEASDNDNAGYIGYQTKEDAQGRNLILFSVWGATDCETSGSNGSHCVGDTDRESGRSVRIWKRWDQGTEYQFQVAKISNRPGWFSGTFINARTGERSPIGNLRFGSQSTAVQPTSSWVEYWNWSRPGVRCADQENSTVVFRPIVADGRTIRYSSTSKSDTCANDAAGSVDGSGSATLRAFPRR